MYIFLSLKVYKKKISWIRIFYLSLLTKYICRNQLFHDLQMKYLNVFLLYHEI